MAIILSGLDNHIFNWGTIIGGDAGDTIHKAGSAIVVQSGAVANIINLGNITAGSGGNVSTYGIDNQGTINSLSNGQGGDVDRLTYRGQLPGSYDVIIHSPNRYGQLAVSGDDITQQMTVRVSALAAPRTGFYENVISGVNATAITNEAEINEGGHGLLSVLSDGAQDNWDLSVLNFGQDMAEPQAFLLKQNWLSVRRTLDYDCDLFDENGVSVTFMTHFDSYESQNLGGGRYGELSGTLLGAKRITEQLHIGGFLDWRDYGDEIQGIDNVNRLPIMGAFAGYSQNMNGTGLQARFSMAYESGQADFSHAALVNNGSVVSGEANYDTYGVGAEAGWGMSLMGSHVVMPFVSINYVGSTRDDYSDAPAANVEDQFSYDSYSAKYTTATLGVRMNGPVTNNIKYIGSLGLESVLSGDTDTFGLTGEFGDASYHTQDTITDWSFNTSAGVIYMLSDASSMTLSGYIRQMEGGQIFTGASLAYNIGF